MKAQQGNISCTVFPKPARIPWQTFVGDSNHELAWNFLSKICWTFLHRIQWLLFPSRILSVNRIWDGTKSMFWIKFLKPFHFENSFFILFLKDYCSPRCNVSDSMAFPRLFCCLFFKFNLFPKLFFFVKQKLLFKMFYLFSRDNEWQKGALWFLPI